MKRTGFLTVVSREDAKRLWDEAASFGSLSAEEVPIAEALGRVVAQDLSAPEDVPSFRRADRDGYAVRAQDTFGATEEDPVTVARSGFSLTPGQEAAEEHAAGHATEVATGAVVPRGADAVVMVEDTREEEGDVKLLHSVVPGQHVTQAGTDVAAGESIARAGDHLTSRDTAVLAACGVGTVPVVGRPKVAVLSTGDEIIPPGADLREGLVRDCNARSLADAVRDAGGVPDERGVVLDERDAVEAAILSAVEASDLVLLSGGTSKGAGDLAGSVLRDMEGAEVLVHGVALKPGKPLLLAVVGGTPLAVLPGFPTSALFTFHEFIAPVIRQMAGLPPHEYGDNMEATLAVRLRSKRGFQDFNLVDLVHGRDGVLAYPVGKGSGSITTFARADGFLAVPEEREQVEAGETVHVTPLGGNPRHDLAIVGSHCAGIDRLLRLVRDRSGFTAKVIAVGSTAGLEAARRGGCDLAGIHLLDEETDTYNAPFVERAGGIVLVPGYRRRQGWVYRPGDSRFEGLDAAQCATAASEDDGFLLAQRNRGSGTRLLIDRLFDGESATLQGGDAELRSHTAVCAAVKHGKADGGVAEETVARAAGLSFAFLREEHFDFAVPSDRMERPSVLAFVSVLQSEEAKAVLQGAGFPA
ncbi:MAG: molybdopterin biosynthesis protein [Planctomycetota bacterium]|jgi:putative molybdopterin biosynthesis protein